MKQGPLFIIRTCPIGDAYRNNFSSYWSFERLLQERPTYLQTLRDNILGANYDHAVRADAAETVIKRINLCLSLCPNDYATASKNNRQGQLVIEQLQRLEKQSALESVNSAIAEAA